MAKQIEPGKIVIFSGMSQSGKTTKAVKLARHYRRVFAWDVEQQWGAALGCVVCKNRRELLDAIKAKKAKIAYQPRADLKKEFEFWAEAAFHFADFGDNSAGCLVIGEELADVTNPAKAPPGWGLLLRRVKKRGVTVFCISQRWAEADKTAIGNADEFFCFRLPRLKDRRYMADEMDGVNDTDIADLGQYEYIHFDVLTKIFKKMKD